MTTFTASIFVIGCPRSGTSALAWSLDKHPALWTSAEANFLSQLYGPRGRIKKLYKEIAEHPRGDFLWLNKNKVTYEEFASYIGWGIDQMYLSRSGGKRWVDQTPAHTLLAVDLMYLFPKAKFLHLVRDGRRVVTSMTNSGFTNKWATDFEEACKTWVHYVERGLQLQEKFPNRVLEVRNEALIEQREETCAQIQEFLGVNANPGPANYLATRWINSSFGPERKTPEAPWEDWTETQSQTFEQVCADLMKTLGYYSS